MNKKSVSAIGIVGILLVVALTFGMYTVHGVSGAPIVENHDTACYQASSTFTTSITTSANALVIFLVQLNTGNPLSVSDNTNLVWNPIPYFEATGDVNAYWAAKPNAGTITVTTVLPSVQHFKVLWLDLLGANISNPLDGQATGTFFTGPETGPTLAVNVMANPGDFVLGYATQVDGAIASNIPTGNSPFATIFGTNNGCFSIATWFAGYQETTSRNGWMNVMTFTLSNQVAGSVQAIRGMSTSSTTSSSSTTTSTSTSSTTSTTTLSTSTSSSTTTATFTTVTSTCTVTFTLSGSNVKGWQAQC